MKIEMSGYAGLKPDSEGRMPINTFCFVFPWRSDLMLPIQPMYLARAREIADSLNDIV